jgi:hypothetical protein
MLYSDGGQLLGKSGSGKRGIVSSIGCPPPSSRPCQLITVQCRRSWSGSERRLFVIDPEVDGSVVEEVRMPMILWQASAFLSKPMRAHPATSGRVHVASVDCHDPQSRDVRPVRTDEAA